MDKKEYVRPRNVNLAFRVSEEERNLVDRKREESGIKCLRSFILKMVFEGRIIRVELDSVSDMTRLLSNATNNINQIARRVNETGNIYAADIDDLRRQYDKLWEQSIEILRRLTSF
ncbi:MAG: MobC family plasmid mobilization relaxosome protein [Oscillospiraceae bacterium]|nr:MobC family plasmid mobilization relaxosome protein [Oscillospiraceae bacterium]MCL2279635.1 MobC family plasmid mobilization relaxosome protein [Oscillospiraceae bacterium]